MKPILTLLAVLLLAPLAVAQAAETKLPNILIVINDDQSWLECSAVWKQLRANAGLRSGGEGGRAVHSRLLFGAVATGTGGAAHGTELPGIGTSAFIQAWLPAKFATLPERLEAAGYHAGYTGKGWGPGVKEPTAASSTTPAST